MLNSKLASKTPRILYVNPTPQVISALNQLSEKYLSWLADVDIENLSSLSQAKNKPFDLIIYNAFGVPDDKLSTWLHNISKQILTHNQVLVPTIILSKLGFNDLNKMLSSIYKDNWYIDILHPDHINSLPIRIANLLKIHDHLHETQRLQKELEDIHIQISKFEKQLHGKKT